MISNCHVDAQDGWVKSWVCSSRSFVRSFSVVRTWSMISHFPEVEPICIREGLLSMRLSIYFHVFLNQGLWYSSNKPCKAAVFSGLFLVDRALPHLQHSCLLPWCNTCHSSFSSTSCVVEYRTLLVYGGGGVIFRQPALKIKHLFTPCAANSLSLWYKFNCGQMCRW